VPFFIGRVGGILGPKIVGKLANGRLPLRVNDDPLGGHMWVLGLCDLRFRTRDRIAVHALRHVPTVSAAMKFAPQSRKVDFLLQNASPNDFVGYTEIAVC